MSKKKLKKKDKYRYILVLGILRVVIELLEFLNKLIE